MALFESYERRIDKINAVLAQYGINGIEDAKAICEAKGIDPYTMCEETQPICFENAKWAYVVGAAIAIKKGCTNAADAAEAIGEGLQAFCIPGSVADDRLVGLGHGNLAARLLREETQCFAFLAGHESFAAAEGAIKIAEMANKVRKNPLRVILNGLGKDAAKIISRINGFTYVQTQFDYYTGEVKEVFRKAVYTLEYEIDVLFVLGGGEAPFIPPLVAFVFFKAAYIFAHIEVCGKVALFRQRQLCHSGNGFQNGGIETAEDPLFAVYIDPADIAAVYRETYTQGLVHFTEQADEGGFLSAGGLAMRDDMEVYAEGNEERILLVSRFDNLGKGASGAAIQNMNIILGIDETLGLTHFGLHP